MSTMTLHSETAGKSTLNPNAPLFIPMAYQQVEDFSPEWWDLVKTTPWFREHWFHEHQEQESFDYDDKEDVADLLPDSIDLGIIDEDLSMAETDFNQALFDESIVGGEGLFSDYEQKFKNGLIGDIETMSFIKSPKNGVRAVFEPAKSWEKAPQLVQPKYSLRYNIQQPR